MKKYTLEAVVEGKKIGFNKKFDSRRSAINYIYKYYDRHFLDNLVINDEYCVDEKRHDIEYVSDYNNRFRIARA